MKIMKIGKGKYKVQSRTNPKEFHLVDLTKRFPTCDCKGFNKNLICFHTIQIAGLVKDNLI